MTDEGIRETWVSRDRPILVSALRRLDSGDEFPGLEDIRLELGLDVVTMRAGLMALETATPPYLTLRYTLAGPEQVGGHVASASERARRELGSWPSAEGLVDQLARALEKAADDEPEEGRRSRLRAAAE